MERSGVLNHLRLLLCKFVINIRNVVVRAIYSNIFHHCHRTNGIMGILSGKSCPEAIKIFSV